MFYVYVSLHTICFSKPFCLFIFTTKILNWKGWSNQWMQMWYVLIEYKKKIKYNKNNFYIHRSDYVSVQSKQKLVAGEFEVNFHHLIESLFFH